MENKYYTPDLEDLRAGYECEYNKNRNGLAEWETHTCYSWEIETWDYNNPEKWIRTKYLDKEDIESLGFTYEGGFEGYHDFRWDVKHELLKGFGMYYKVNLMYRVDGGVYPPFYPNTLSITYYTGGITNKNSGEKEPHSMHLYLGPCPSINELKYLMKLLHFK